MLCLIEFWFSFVDSWARVDGLILVDFVTLCSDSKPSSLVLYPPESRVHLNQSYCVLEKTPILLGISSIPPKPWSDSSIPSVDIFTSPLWSWLRILVRFGLDLILRSSSFWARCGLKSVSGLGQSFYLSPVKPTLVVMLRRFNRWVGRSMLGFWHLTRCTDV